MTSFDKRDGLKSRELELNEVTGSASHITKDPFDIVPATRVIAVSADNMAGILRDTAIKEDNTKYAMQSGRHCI